jgi:hypothetical protein
VDLIAVARLAGWEKFVLDLVRKLEICGDTFDDLIRSSGPAEASERIE